MNRMNPKVDEYLSKAKSGGGNKEIEKDNS
jgi:hypothetical protein